MNVKDVLERLEMRDMGRISAMLGNRKLQVSIGLQVHRRGKLRPEPSCGYDRLVLKCQTSAGLNRVTVAMTMTSRSRCHWSLCGDVRIASTGYDLKT